MNSKPVVRASKAVVALYAQTCRSIAVAATLATFTSVAMADDDTSVKGSAKRAGQTVGTTAKDVGKEAKSAAPSVWQSMKNAGKSIAAGAKKAGSEAKPGAKRAGAAAADGARSVGTTAKESGKKAKEKIAGADKPQ